MPIGDVYEKFFPSATGIKGREDVLQMGIGSYNDECRSIVMR